MPSKFDRCVAKVKANSPSVNPYAVCMKTVGKGSASIRLADLVDDDLKFKAALKRIMAEQTKTVILSEVRQIAEHDKLKRPPERILLFRDGETGIGDFRFDKRQAELVIANFRKRGVDIPIDYHHASESSLSDKQVKAPAAGWIRGMEWIDGEGLYATDIQWTEKAKREILALEYKYYSPAFLYDRESGDIEELTSAALTNMPRTKNQRELLLQAAERKAGTMPKHALKWYGEWPDTIKDKLKALADELLPGVDVTTDALPDPEVENVDEVGKLIQGIAEALGMDPNGDSKEILSAAIDKLTSGSDTTAEDQKVAAEIAKRLGVKLELVTAEIDKMKVKASRSDTLAKQVGTLERQVNELLEERENSRIDALLAEQIDAGKINPNDEAAVNAARGLAKSDEEGFRALFASMAASVPSGTFVTDKGGKSTTRRDSKIKEFLAEYREHKDVIQSKAETFVDVSLQQVGMSPMTDDEKKRFCA